MTSLSRRLFFKSVDLGDDVALKLFLMPRVASTNPSPVLWRETTLGASGPYSLDLTWDAHSVNSGTNRMVFYKHQGAPCEQTVSAATWVPIEIGQETTLFEKPTCLTDGGPPTYAFTKPIPREDHLSAVKAVNNTGHPVILSLGMTGLVTDKSTVDEVIYSYETWKVEEGHDIQTDLLEPVLRAYVLLKHQEGGCVIGDIGTNKPVWEVKVLSLDPQTTIDISKDKLTGKFSATIRATALPLPLPVKPLANATPEPQVPPKKSITEQPTTEKDDAANPPSVHKDTRSQSSDANTETTPCVEGNNSLTVPGNDKPVIRGEPGSANGQSVSEPTTTMPAEKVGQETIVQPKIITIGSVARHQIAGTVEPHKDGDHKKGTDGTDRAVSISDTSGPSKETNGVAAYEASNGVPGGPNPSDPPKDTSVVANGSD